MPRILDQRGYTEPPCHHFRVNQMRRINNSVQAFLDDSRGFERGEGTTKARELYDSYSFHMRDVGRGRPVSFERFLQMLEDLDFQICRDVLGDYVVDGLRKIFVTA